MNQVQPSNCFGRIAGSTPSTLGNCCHIGIVGNGILARISATCPHPIHALDSDELGRAHSRRVHESVWTNSEFL